MQYAVTFSENGFDEDRHMADPDVYASIEGARFAIQRHAKRAFGDSAVVSFVNTLARYNEEQADNASDPDFERQTFDEYLEMNFYSCKYEDGDWFDPNSVVEEAHVKNSRAKGYRYYAIQEVK